jgi:hypothetical protein
MKTKFILILLFITAACNCFAQNTLTGSLVNKDSKNPIASAVVFLNKTGISTASTDNGTFTLNNIPKGQYLLIITIIGYEDTRIPVNIESSKQMGDIELAIKNHSLDSVVVTTKRRVSPYYYSFEKAFLGPTSFARQCKILNPSSIQFYDTDILGNYSARSVGFIEVQNDALGYKIKTILNNFSYNIKTSAIIYSGESYFTEMQGSPAQQREWQKNRLECYQGSVMQFLRSVLANTVKENGFSVKRVHRELNPYFNRNGLETDPEDMNNAVDVDLNTNTRYNDKISGSNLSGKDMLLKTNVDGLFAITANNGFIVNHSGNTVISSGNKITRIPWIWHSTVCVVTFNKPYAIFDHNGIIGNPDSVSYSQSFFSESSWVATLLPFDYQPI